MSIHLPPLPKQKRIAEILGALDDKIELNRRMNRTLEAMARALFQSWFMDFDPVHAKARGEIPYGMDDATAALFPDSFEETALGLVPQGWEISSVGEEFHLLMGQSPPGETYNEQGIGLPFYQGRRDFGNRFPSIRVFCTAPTRIAKQGDTLVSVRAPVGAVNMALQECCIGRGVAAIRHKSLSCSYTYYSMLVLEPAFKTFEGEGTVFGSISGNDFKKIPFVKPSEVVIQAYDAIISVMDSQIKNNEVEIRTLTTLRDGLLPKLTSGVIQIRNRVYKINNAQPIKMVAERSSVNTYRIRSYWNNRKESENDRSPSQLIRGRPKRLRADRKATDGLERDPRLQRALSSRGSGVRRTRRP